MIGLDDVRAAAARLEGRIRRTPLVPADALLRPLGGADVRLKLECLQATGSFKARGATNKLASLNAGQLKRGVVTASGGNHGLAVARAGHLAQAPTSIFLPRNVSPAKVEKLKGWGARVEIVGDYWDEANERALAFAQATGGAYFHPFADPLVVAGQGTVALEILEQAPPFDTLLVAIGGGGLIAGIATAMKALKPEVRIIGIEPEGSPTLKASLDAGRVVRLEEVTTSVPTMACRQTDPRIFEIVRRHVDEIVLVSDEAMLDGARWLWFEMGLAADLSGAAAVAAMLAGSYRARPDERIVALVCGAGPEGTVAAPTG
jgi:threonine dehydratase